MEEEKKETKIEGKTQEEYAKESKSGEKKFWIAVGIGYLIIYIPSFFVPPVMFGTIHLSWWIFVLFLQIIYTIASLREQKQNEVGAKTFFGKVLYETGPGLVFTPFFFCEHIKASSLIKQWEIPTDLPLLYGKDKEGNPITSLRMTTAPTQSMKSEGEKKEENDPLQTGRLTIEGKILVLARLDKEPGGFFQFVETMGSLNNFLEIADDLAVNTFRKEIAKKSPSEVFEEWEKIEQLATEALVKRVGSYGFVDLSVKAKEFDLPYKVNQALAARTSAHASVETERLKGEGIMKRDILVAKAVKALETAPIEGRIEALIVAMNKDGMNLTAEQAVFMAYQEVIKSALKDANYTLLPQGQGGMLDPASMMSIMQEAIKVSQEGSEKKKEKQEEKTSQINQEKETKQ